LSSTIFILCMQCLSKTLKQDEIFKGVVIESEKMSMFTDDILHFLSGTNEQFQRIFYILNEFALHSNCKLNMAKCQAFHIGSNRGSSSKPFLDKSLQWSTDIFKYLGVLVPVKKR